MCVWVGKWTRFLRRRTQLQDTRANAQGRIIGNKHRKGLGTGRAVFVEMDVGPVSPSSTTQDTSHRARNGTLDRNTESGWDSRADISGNARHFCDGEFNYTGYERNPSLCEGFGCRHCSSHNNTLL